MTVAAFAARGTPALAAGGYELSSSFGSFLQPEAVAVDQASHDVYVVDMKTNTVKRFDAMGNPVSFGASQPYIRENELKGTPGGTFNFDGSGSATELAVDGSGGPANGDLYVADSNNTKVDVFAPDGTFLGEVNPALAAPESGGEPCGVAVDPAGKVYVGHFSGHVDRYIPVDGNPEHDVFSAQLESVGEICQVAADSTGNVYVDTWPSGPLRKYEPSQFGVVGPTGTEVDATAYAVAVDPTNDHLFVDHRTQIAEYEASGGAVGAPFGELESSRGVAVDGTSGDVYVSDRAAGKVDVFAIPVPSAPIVKNEFAANVTSTSADLRAEVNPKLRDAKYFFRYGTDTSYASGDVPAAPGADIGEGSKALAEQVELRGLAAGETYHYQVVARNELGTTHGPDHTFTTSPSASSVALPDNRVWELVSPPEKHSADVLGIFASEEALGSGAPMQASPNGEAITYAAVGSFANAQGAPRGSQYLARRGLDGWSTQNITPPLLSVSYGLIGLGTPYKAFASDLASGLLINGETRPVENTPLAPNMPAGYQNFYLHGLLDESFQALLTTAPTGETPEHFVMEVEGTTPDLSHVVFATNAALSTGTVDNGERNLYEWSGGQLQPVNILSGGEPAPGAVVGSGFFEGHAVSDDGSRVFWSHGNVLYMHENGVPTVQIGESGIFRTASNDGSRAFFSDGLRLTSDSTAHGRGVGEDLYIFNATTRKLTDITVDNDPADANGAGVEGVLGASTDGSYVYFVAKGSLASGAVSGENNLYVWHEGEIRFIAALAKEDEAESGTQEGIAHDWSESSSWRTARVTPSGEFAVFMSRASLTGYDNTDRLTGLPDEEVYLYNAHSGHLSCISCNPSNERPIGPAGIPGGTRFESGGVGGKSLYQPRVISEDGRRVFFETKDALVPQDTNGQLDVYEYENGHAYLISGGTSSEESSLVDTSANGSDVFFVTGQPLVAQDTDTLVDLYDARENGGFPPLPAPPPACGGEECRLVMSPQPVFGAPSSMTVGPSENLPSRPGRQGAKAKRKVKHRATKHRHGRRRSNAKGRNGTLRTKWRRK
ncbi:MAG TPA: NHL repeat-containing protein [Solirubrobacteraceae bacterium]|nr:NHL repeat-containing protein [Solirubrobacteraceae bacterium]